MLQAEVRTPNNSVRFYGEVNQHNLQTLGMYAAQNARFDAPAVQVWLLIDHEDEKVFSEHWERWQPRLQAAGADVDVRIRFAVAPSNDEVAS